jgi:outer membrane protein TolC
MHALSSSAGVRWETNLLLRAARLAARLLPNFLVATLLITTARAAYRQRPTTPAPQTPTQSQQPPTPAQSPNPQSSPRTSSSPQPTASATPNASATPGATPFVTAPNVTASPPPSATQTTITTSSLAAQTNAPISLDDALKLAGAQISGLQQARLNELVASEDVRQARAALLPKVTAPVAYIYTTPALGLPPGEPRVQSFIANNAIGEYQALVNVAGDVDISGRLHAALARNRALLEAARAGTEIARRTLEQATVEAYYGLALATAERRGAEQNLAAAQEFENVTALLLDGGEVAAVDFIRARLQTVQRRDELERARANESVAADSLRVLVGYDTTRQIDATDLTTLMPTDAEVARFNAETIQQRPEFTQFDAELRAAKQDIRAARAERFPQLSYSISGGFDTDSMHFPRLKEHTGASAAFNLSIPVFDWGASRSRERQAELRAQITENERAQALRNFNQQFNSARTQALSAAARIRIAASGIALAQSNLDASIARYRAGEAQIIEVTDAQTGLAAQRVAFFQAIFDYQVALARLRQAAGK